MKINAILFFLLSGYISVNGQTAAEDAQFRANFDIKTKESQLLAVKLYPDCALAGSPLVQNMMAEDNKLKAKGSRIYYLAEKPFILTVVSAHNMGLRPQWENLNETEKSLAYAEMVQVLTWGTDLSPASQQTAAVVPAPQHQPVLQPAPSDASSFNPGSIDQPIARNSYVAPQRQNTAPQGNTEGQPTVAGFHFYLQSLINESGGLKPRRGTTVGYKQGPLAGMDVGQGEAYAQSQWEILGHDEQMVYEQKAKMYGDPIAKQQEKDSHTVTGTVQSATTGEVQYINIQSQ